MTPVKAAGGGGSTVLANIACVLSVPMILRGAWLIGRTWNRPPVTVCQGQDVGRGAFC